LCQKATTISVGEDDISRSVKHIENCRFKEMNLSFYQLSRNKIPVDQLPSVLWEKVGTKIQTLSFSRCSLGNNVLMNVILNCDNLQRLYLYLKTGDSPESVFGSLSTLKSLKIVRKKLETFEIQCYEPDESFVIKNEFRKWKRTFMALFKIFPNVIHFKSEYFGNAWRFTHQWFSCKFTKELACGGVETDESKLASGLAYSLSCNERNWKKALNALSTPTIRFACESLSKIGTYLIT